MEMIPSTPLAFDFPSVCWVSRINVYFYCMSKVMEFSKQGHAEHDNCVPVEEDVEKKKGKVCMHWTAVKVYCFAIAVLIFLFLVLLLLSYRIDIGVSVCYQIELCCIYRPGQVLSACLVLLIYCLFERTKDNKIRLNQVN